MFYNLATSVDTRIQPYKHYNVLEPKWLRDSQLDLTKYNRINIISSLSHRTHDTLDPVSKPKTLGQQNRFSSFRPP